MSIYSIPPLIVSVFTLFLSLLALIYGKKLIYSLLAFCTFIWLAGYTAVYSIRDYELALFLVRILYIGVVFIPAFFYHFAVSFVNPPQYLKAVRFNYFISLIFAFLISSPYFISGLYSGYWGYQTKAGWLHNIFLIYFAIVIGRAIALLYSYYRKKMDKALFLDAARARYVLLAFCAAAFASLDFMPDYGIRFYPLGFIFVSLHLVIIAYAVLVYRLMDMKSFLVRALIFVILYAVAFGAPFILSKQEKSWLTIIFGPGWFWPFIFILFFFVSLGPFIYFYIDKNAQRFIRKEQIEFQRKLKEASFRMMLCTDQNTCLKELVSNLRDIIKVEWVAIYLKDGYSPKYAIKQIHPQEARANLPQEFALNSVLAQALYSYKFPLIKEEMQSAVLKADLAVPIILYGDMLGFLLLGDRPKHRLYEQGDLDAIAFFSDQTALALENSRLYSIEKERVEEIENTLNTKSQFMSMVSHELRTPLSAIKANIGVVLDERSSALNAEQRSFLSIAKENVDRLTRLINAILDLQALTAGKVEYKLEEADINELIQKVQQTMIPLAQNKQLDFTLELKAGLPKARIDRDKITQVLTNLVNNAIQNTEKGRITITTHEEDNSIRVSVIDTGIGIAQKDLPKLFQQFVQVKRKTGRTGLGLAICREIIDAHNGKIWVESELGRGTVFHFILPIFERRS